MATSAFKSTTKRDPIGSDASSSSSTTSTSAAAHHRRSRSLSRFSRRLPDDERSADLPRGKFVNTMRGSGVPEISLDDLALELFSPILNGDKFHDGEMDRERRVGRRVSDVGRWADETASSSSRRRGRSVSRQGSANSKSCENSRTNVGESKSEISKTARGKSVTSTNQNAARRRRSVSAVRCQISDSESDLDHARGYTSNATIKGHVRGSSQTPVHKAITSSNPRLERSHSQKDLLLLHDGYSSQSSALTDDETRNARSGKNRIEKTIRAVYAQKKADHPTEDVLDSGLYEAMRKELRNAVDEIRIEVAEAIKRKNTGPTGDHSPSDKMDVLQAFSAIRSNYVAELQQSGKRKQDLLAEIKLEKQRGKELSQIVKELLPDLKGSAVAQKPARARKRSNDRNRMSKALTEEAERYFEDFLSNVEDTDLSSFDGERSDTSSTLGAKPRDFLEMDYQSPAGCNPQPVEMDGVILPWLQWETSNEGSLLRKNMMQTPVTPKTLLWDADQGMTSRVVASNYSGSSHGSWNPALVSAHPVSLMEDAASKFTTSGSKFVEHGDKGSSRFDMGEYMKLQSNDELLSELYRERNRITSGGLLLCTNIL